jgi:predicted AAA+ superfamily ATPase
MKFGKFNGDAVFTEFKGAITEQFVFQQLLPKEEIVIHYYTFSNSKYEIDFIIQNENDEIIPIEVKSGENLKARSFRLFCEKFEPTTAILSSLSNYQIDKSLINVPLYIADAYFTNTLSNTHT